MEGLEFRLLGDVEADLDGRPVDLGPARQRCVLAALLVDANRTVPTARLLERVWADQLPERARVTLAGYVSRLRHALAKAPDVAIPRRTGGYQVTVNPMAVDLHRFRHLLAEARTAGEGRRLALLEEALRQWRGELAATLDTPWLAGLRVTLEAERHAAELDRNDLALAHGEHAALVGALCASAISYPLDERLAGQVMLALYRCGRQAEALQRYEQIRRSLAEELGTDPDAALRRLYLAILAGDPEPAATIPAVPAPVRPRQLPAPLPAFIGRDRELAQLDAFLANAGDPPTAPVIAILCGTAGVGKTTLAVRWAHAVAATFPDGQLYANLRGFDPNGTAMNPADAVRGFVEALGVPAAQLPVDLAALAALYRTRLADKRVLVVLDNAQDADQVRPLLPGTPGCAVVVTSRDQLSGLVAVDGAHPLTVDLFTPAEAEQLMACRLGPARVAAEPETTAEIAQRCARLPLAMAIVAARAATRPGQPLAAFAGELRDARGLDPFAGNDAASDIRAVFACSYRALEPATARLFRLLGLHPGPDLSVPAAASLAGIRASHAHRLLTELADAHLLTEHSPRRYGFHDLLRAYSLEQTSASDSQAERRAALGRLFDHYLHDAYTADQLIYPPHDPIAIPPVGPGVTSAECADHTQALAWFVAELPSLLAAVERAGRAGFDRHAWQLAWALTSFLNLRGHWPDQIAVQSTAIEAAARLGDRLGQANAHRSLGRAYGMLGQTAEAKVHLRRALDLFGSAGDPVGQAVTHTNLARMYESQGRPELTLRNDRLALDLFRVAGDRPGQARALNNIGWELARRRRHREALAHCRQALVLHRAAGNRHGEATVWDSLGFIHGQQGRHDQAADCYRRALRLFRGVADRPNEADVLARLGDTYHAAGRPGDARDSWRCALAIYDELANPSAADVRHRLATMPVGA